MRDLDRWDEFQSAAKRAGAKGIMHGAHRLMLACRVWISLDAEQRENCIFWLGTMPFSRGYEPFVDSVMRNQDWRAWMEERKAAYGGGREPIKCWGCRDAEGGCKECQR